jgi:hypothetical protein
LINHAGSGDIIVLKWGDMEYVQALCWTKIFLP